jgi:predicted O-methyltransferase YrrM
MPSVLFLDDDHDRHDRFRQRIEALGYLARYRMIYVHSAADAIAALRAHEGEITQAFLDHDLSVEDQLVLPGQPTLAPTGMIVVDHIVTMRRPPEAVVVHSLNYTAAVEMCARLTTHGKIAVTRVPFSQLLMHLT